MERTYSRIKNYNVSVKEVDNKVIFLRKLEPGGSEHSFGIHVAKMAGMPKSIVKRADEILALLEKENRQGSISGKEKEITSELKKKKGASSSSTSDGIQLNFFQWISIISPLLKL